MRLITTFAIDDKRNRTMVLIANFRLDLTTLPVSFSEFNFAAFMITYDYRKKMNLEFDFRFPFTRQIILEMHAVRGANI